MTDLEVPKYGQRAVSALALPIPIPITKCQPHFETPTGRDVHSFRAYFARGENTPHNCGGVPLVIPRPCLVEASMCCDVGLLLLLHVSVSAPVGMIDETSNSCRRECGGAGELSYESDECRIPFSPVRPRRYLPIREWHSP